MASRACLHLRQLLGGLGGAALQRVRQAIGRGGEVIQIFALNGNLEGGCV